ncbi:MAG: OmpA family protein [Leptospiraceae bacterium]|nr:OmpA family protein [Leptospiraceae bacterium]
MKQWILVGITSLHFFALGVIAKEQVVVGTLIGSGQYIETEDKTYPLKYSELGKELTEYTGKKIRMLCEIEEDSCTPIRYELSPFSTEINLPKWTIKTIPKYVYRGLTAFNPTVTPDGNMLFWTVLLEQQGTSTQKIWYSELDKNGFWKRGIQMDPPLNNKAPSAVIAAMPGGNELFVFGSYSDQEVYNELKKRMEFEKMELLKTAKTPREYEVKLLALRENYRKEFEKIQNKVPLYKSYRKEKSWSTPEQISFPEFYNLYRSEENNMLQVFGGSTLSSSGRVLVYSAKHKDVVGKLDLYVSKMDDNGNFSIGQNLGKQINTEFEEMAPFLASDDRTLYFSSNGHGGLTVYVTQRIGEDWNNWSAPQEISKNLKGVNYFSIPASGNWAYVSRQGQLLMTFLPNEMKPNAVMLVKGKVTDDAGLPLSVKIEYESLTNGQKRGSTISDPETGTYSIVLPYGDNYGFHAEKENYMPVHKNKDLRTGDASLYQEHIVDMVLPRIEVGQEFIINNLFFDHNSYEIKKESEPELDRIGKIMITNKELQISLEGHTDNTGRNEDNVSLSLSRANAVADYLKEKHGIAKERLKVAGYGEIKPLVPNDTPENRAKNRRVVLKILKKGLK